jgi:hypothetical protein
MDQGQHQNPIRIGTIEDIEQLLIKSQQRMAFEFAFESLSTQRNLELQNIVRTNYKACGCQHGATFGLLGVLAAFAWLVLRWFQAEQMPSATMWIFLLATALVLVGIGRAWGRYLSKRKIQNVLKEISEMTGQKPVRTKKLREPNLESF